MKRKSELGDNAEETTRKEPEKNIFPAKRRSGAPNVCPNRGMAVGKKVAEKNSQRKIGHA